MQKDILIRIIETNKGNGTLGSAIRKAAKVASKPARKVYLKDDEEKWMEEGLSWIESTCKSGKCVVNITSQNWYYSVGSFHKDINKRFPLEVHSVGGLIWVERDELDKWIEEVKKVGKFITVTKVGKGSTPDYYPELIFRYELISNSELL